MRRNGWRLAMQSPISRLMHVYWRFARGLTMGVRAVVIDGNGCIFLVKHSYTDGWHLPGGGVEAGETLLAALSRELAEEGNIELVTPPALHGVYYHPKYSNRDHIALFVVRGFRQPSKPAPNREIIAHGFFPLDALPTDTTSGTRARLAEVLDGALVSPNW
jgi:8-oxo-dGTP pyrophosphatase MutT (NUDIX family)